MYGLRKHRLSLDRSRNSPASNDNYNNNNNSNNNNNNNNFNNNFNNMSFIRNNKHVTLQYVVKKIILKNSWYT